MKNKWFSRGLWFALVLTLVLGLTLATAPSASAETSGDWTYTVSGGVATVTGYTGSTARISIPGSFGSYTVTAVGANAFKGNTTIQSVSFPSTLLSIGDNAFSDCVNLTEVTLPEKLTYLGNYSFSNCTKLSKLTINSVSINNKDDYRDEPFYNAGSATDGMTVTFASGCTRVPSYLFFAYSGPSTAANLKSVIFADSVTSIGTAAFQDCPTLSTVSFGSGLTTIENRAFSGCAGLKTFTLPAAVTSIGNYAFCGTGLTGFTLSDSLTSIGEGAFSECTNLTELTLPKKLTNLGNYSFSNCTKLSSITIHSVSINNKDDYRDEPFYNVGSATDGVTVTFASGCTRVPSYLFFAYSGPSTAANLKSVIFADS
ncbi:MAG: leucine-rich repeat domain-containing protein, partial [Clostridiales bacterium]|nr:leucine-rich repeat domain-containing protein [Clostridiales bacterium]